MILPILLLEIFSGNQIESSEWIFNFFLLHILLECVREAVSNLARLFSCYGSSVHCCGVPPKMLVYKP